MPNKKNVGEWYHIYLNLWCIRFWPQVSIDNNSCDVHGSIVFDNLMVQPFFIECFFLYKNYRSASFFLIEDQTKIIVGTDIIMYVVCCRSREETRAFNIVRYHSLLNWKFSYRTFVSYIVYKSRNLRWSAHRSWLAIENKKRTNDK